jgi:N-acetylglucosamine-6-sulfatase
MPLGRSALTAAVLAGAALLASLLTALPPVLHVASPAAAAAGRQKPNVVVVLTDDMRADELRLLPAVRRLQRSGVTFTRALSADSLCCPARATLLTGKLAHNHLTLGNDASTHGGYSVFAAHNDIRRLLPQWLDHQGYRTAWIGKYLNGFPPRHSSDQPGWSYFAVPVHGIYDYRSSAFAINGRVQTDDRYRELYTRRLLFSRLRAWSSGDRPFFVLYSALAPHKAKPLVVGGNSLPRAQSGHRDFDPRRLVIAPSVGENDVSDKPAWLQAYVAKVGPQPYPLPLETHRVEALESVNDTVRHLVATLRDLHEEKQTIVIFTSDNGFVLGEHDLADKNKAYDESVHVPLVVRGPGFRGGVRAEQTVSLADVTATIRRAAGVTRSHGADGLPLQDVLANPEAFASRPVEIEGSQAQYPQQGDLPTDPIGRFYSGAVWGPYSFVSYRTGDHEFYDRSTDPWQLDNAYSADPMPGSPQALLQAWYAAHVDCQGAACNDPVPAP